MIWPGNYLKTVHLQILYINDIPHLDDTKINNLLSADGLAIFSQSKEDLQKGISILEQYRNEWGSD